MQAAQNVLMKKLHHGGVARSPLPDADAVGQAFARQIGEKLRPMVKATVSAMVLESKTIKVSEAVEDISVPSMLGLVEVEHASIPGLLVVDTDLAYHFIDLILGGDPTQAPVPITRAFTEIDRAICRLPMDVVISSFVEALATSSGKAMDKKIRIVDLRQDITQTRFAPEYVDVLMFQMVLDIGDAARSGNIFLLLPLATLDVVYAAMKEETTVTEARPQDLWKKMMRRAASVAPVSINAELHRKKMSIAAVEAMRVGDVIDFPAGAPENVTLTLSHQGGKTSQVATGCLGAYQDKKVIKLTSPVDPRILDQIRRSV